jgi:hypothetical protein
MGRNIYLGNAEDRPDTGYITFGGTWEATDVINITYGGATVSIIAGSTSITTILATVLAALEDEDNVPPQFNEVTWTNEGATKIEYEGPDDGAPVGAHLSVTTTETGGGVADAQTLVHTNTLAGTGKRDYNNVENWSLGALPVDADDVDLGLGNDCPRYNVTGHDDIELTSLTVWTRSSDDQRIGLTPYNEDGGYYEFRGQNLVIDATTFRYGAGSGPLVPAMSYDAGATAQTVYIEKTNARDANDDAPLHYLANTVNAFIYRCAGNLDVATRAGTTASLGYVSANDSGLVKLGKGVTCTDIYGKENGVVRHFGVTNTTNIAMRDSSVLSLEGDGSTNTHTAVRIYDVATLNLLRNTVTITFLELYGTFDVRNGAVVGSRTITACDRYFGSNFYDPHKYLTLTAGIDCVGFNPADEGAGDMDLGPNLRVTRGTVA